jgi:hypothetical protein
MMLPRFGFGAAVLERDDRCLAVELVVECGVLVVQGGDDRGGGFEAPVDAETTMTPARTHLPVQQDRHPIQRQPPPEQRSQLRLLDAGNRPNGDRTPPVGEEQLQRTLRTSVINNHCEGPTSHDETGIWMKQ